MNLRAFSFIILSCFSSYLFLSSSERNETIYILLDRNSQNVNYMENNWCKNGVMMFDKFYRLKTYGKDNFIQLTFTCFDPKLDYSDFDMVKDIKFHRENKPITFLDSIYYYDETYILNAELDFEKKLRKSRIFILDKGTIKNDSIMMYEAAFHYTGFEE